MKKIEVSNPYDNYIIGTLDYMDYDKISNKLENAHKLFLDKRKWLKPYHRITILENFLSLLKLNKLEIVRQAVIEGGKPFVDSKIEIERAINGVQIAINTIPNLMGRQIPMEINSISEHRVAYTYRDPIGVIFAISAFNHPVNLIIHQVITALASNCPIIIKPASKTPFSCIKILELLEEAGLPEFWCQLALCTNEVTSKIIGDSRISYMSFIGSADVGWKLRSLLGEGSSCCLEHGGVAPIIMCEDADIDSLLPLIVKGGFYHAGQVCVSIQRLFIHEFIVNEVTEQLIKLTNRLIVGDPQLEDIRIEVGPLITPENVNRVDNWVKKAIKKGAKLLCGGEKISDTCYKPTLLLNPPDDTEVSQQELFGPVICIYTYDDRNKAILRANSLPYAFQAAVFTRNLDVAIDTIKKIDATAVMVNDHSAFRVDWMPFGGRKRSGLGSSGIINSMFNMTYEKMAIIRSKSI
ncbi:MAG: aldehyde dehydrogenase family protein [Bacteroidetes bacterium]|nr:aldehyde dehydrogenase family protein [Bacteroidota bacterium]